MKKFVAMFLTLALTFGSFCFAGGEEYDYDHAFGELEDRVVYLEEKKNTALLTPEKFYVFSENGAANVYETGLAAKDIKAMFTDESAAYYLTGSTRGYQLIYTLNRVTQNGLKKNGSIYFPPKERTEPNYTENFIPYGVRYTLYKKSVVFEAIPRTEDGVMSPVQFGFILNSLSPFFSMEEDTSRMRINQHGYYVNGHFIMPAGWNGKQSEYFGKQFSASEHGGYDSLLYMPNLHDFALKNGNKVSLFFTEDYADKDLIKNILKNERSGLFMCDNEFPDSTGDPLPKYSQPELIVEAYGENTLIQGDITEFGNGILSVGKDADENSGGFKNAYIAFYDKDVRKAKKTFITDFTKKDEAKVSTPRIMQYDKDTYVLWYETKDGKTVMKYGKLNKNAAFDGTLFTVEKDGIVPIRPLMRENKLYYVTETDGAYSINTKNIKAQ
ncbi:MAG: hypothetical protein IJR45_01640 [Firmicutes bacterium]|nr:hypothetical protein [Bacillota bacterium]MBQ9604096.1 hypothetical protein [Bacillota bacterium]